MQLKAVYSCKAVARPSVASKPLKEVALSTQADIAHHRIPRACTQSSQSSTNDHTLI